MSDCVSIIICFYNEEKKIKRCIESARRQTYPNLDIILVDDGSNDSSARIAKAFAKADSRITYVHQDNEGVASARNLGLEYAIGRWIYYADADDYIEEHAIETMLLAAKTNKVNAVSAAYILNRNTRDRKRIKKIHVKEGVYRDAELMKYFYTHPNNDYLWKMLFLRECFDNVTFPVGLIYEEATVMPQLLYNASSLAVVDKVVYHYNFFATIRNSKKAIVTGFQFVDARLKNKEFALNNCPENIGYASALVLEAVAMVLSRIYYAGIDEHKAEFDRAVKIFNDELPQAQIKSFKLKVAVKLFKINPELLAKLSYHLSQL